jgi:hypothetical protein
MILRHFEPCGAGRTHRKVQEQKAPGAPAAPNTGLLPGVSCALEA